MVRKFIARSFRKAPVFAITFGLSEISFQIQWTACPEPCILGQEAFLTSILGGLCGGLLCLILMMFLFTRFIYPRLHPQTNNVQTNNIQVITSGNL